jgi:hypothetical protein
MIETQYTVDHDEIMLRARQMRAEVMAQLMISLFRFVFRRKTTAATLAA